MELLPWHSMISYVTILLQENYHLPLFRAYLNSSISLKVKEWLLYVLRGLSTLILYVSSLPQFQLMKSDTAITSLINNTGKRLDRRMMMLRCLSQNSHCCCWSNSIASASQLVKHVRTASSAFQILHFTNTIYIWYTYLAFIVPNWNINSGIGSLFWLPAQQSYQTICKVIKVSFSKIICTVSPDDGTVSFNELEDPVNGLL